MYLCQVVEEEKVQEYMLGDGGSVLRRIYSLGHEVASYILLTSDDLELQQEIMQDSYMVRYIGRKGENELVKYDATKKK